MVNKISGERNTQIFMIVWDIDLKIVKKESHVDISTPRFSINPTRTENVNWIQLQGFDNQFIIFSNLSTLRDFKVVTTYLINPATNTIVDEYNGFETFSWNNNQLCEKKRFVFKLKMQSASSAVSPIIWIRCATEIKPPINKDGIILNLDSISSTQAVLNNQGVLCEINTYQRASTYNFNIIPEKPTENWNFLTEMLRKKSDNIWELCYFHTAANSFVGRSSTKFYPRIIFEVKELNQSVDNMSVSDIEAVTSVINSHANDKQRIRPMNILSSPILLEYFNINKLCDITVQVGDQKIRAHKVVLAAASTIWRNIFFEDDTVATIIINDFQYGTIKELIEFMYTGIVKQPIPMIDQLFCAADKYGVLGLKELCEGMLIENIEMKTVVNLMVLADLYKASRLSDMTMKFIEDNCEAFKELEEAKSIFMMYPELAFKLFTKIA